jgi:hypothetical protein
MNELAIPPESDFFASLDAYICDAEIYRDEELIFRDSLRVLEPLQLRTFEIKAQTEPGSWKLIVNWPFWNGVYYRIGQNLWILVDSGKGYA